MGATWPKISGLDAALKGAERQIYDLTHKRASGRVRQVVGFARSRWPVGRPQNRKHSRDLFRIEDKSNGTNRVHIIIQNDAKDAQGTPYAFFIRSARVPGAGKKNAWQVLVRRPMLKALKDLAADIANDPLGRG